MIVAHRLQVTAIAGVADQRFVALGELPLQSGHDRGAIDGILLGFRTVAADDVASAGQHHGLGLVVGLLAVLLQREWHEWSRIIEHEFWHQFVGTLRTPRI